MPQYMSIPRAFRPQKFKDVLEQETIVQVLKNAIKLDKVSHAYLFCGSRGSGKTTLARLFAKALNCINLSEDFEPCNQCSNCQEITSSSSLDVLEIDGASNRGIDDIRQLSDNTIYAPSSAKYKIYIVDEVHMLTKEAFNALLKTLEEPPEKVKFFFATTEPHKVLPTIVSRCQRFDLKRISCQSLIQKLKMICQSLTIDYEDKALHALADMADGSLRDAESLLDQALCSENKKLTYSHVSSLLGLPSEELFYQLDEAYKNFNLQAAFQITDTLYSEGNDYQFFLQKLIEHFQNIIKIKLGTSDFEFFSAADLEKLQTSAKLYDLELCLDLCDYLLDQLAFFHHSGLKKCHIELILLHIIRSSRSLSVGQLSQKLLKLSSETRPSDTKPKEADPKVLVEEPPKPNKVTPETPKAPTETKEFKSSQTYETLLRFTGVEFNGTVQKPRG